MPTDSAKHIRDRAFSFGCTVARLALSLAPKPGIRALIDQLLRSGTSIGANLEEAKAASTRREFLRGVEISLREAREAWYWLRIYKELHLGDPQIVSELVNEADSIVRILTSIVLDQAPDVHCRRSVCILHSEFCIASLVVISLHGLQRRAAYS